MHGLGHGIHNDRVLLPARLFHDSCKSLNLKDTGHGKDNDGSSNQLDIHTEYFKAQGGPDSLYRFFNFFYNHFSASISI